MFNFSDQQRWDRRHKQATFAEKELVAEHIRLKEDSRREKNWKRWGPYLSERQWGTVREDYSRDGDVWNYVTHDMSRSYAYRWGEDGLLGITDRQCRLCFHLALWNGKDPILKERLFGLSGTEGNHGEDVKEEYFYLNATPTSSYLKGLYKYPQNEFPYADLVETNRRRTKYDPEYEILDTGVFNEGRYWDVIAEYAKGSPNVIAIRITLANRGPDDATIHLLPTLFHRNVWSFRSPYEDDIARKTIILGQETHSIETETGMGLFHFDIDPTVEMHWLFTENDSNTERLYGVQSSPYTKDSFHRYVIYNEKAAVHPSQGSKAAALIVLNIPAGKEVQICARLFLDSEKSSAPNYGPEFHQYFEQKIKEHNEFYMSIIPDELTEEEVNVCIQAFAGLNWSKQFYHYVVDEWLNGDPGMPTPPENRKRGRNIEWKHLFCRDIISMPDKWEFNWFATWDLAFHTVAIALMDPDFAKDQLLLFLREWYMHPNGALPAYEFALSDTNPPVHAWAVWRVYRFNPDTDFLERAFQKLIPNFYWWVNRLDPDGLNLYRGGFLGLDNIGVFDRSFGLPKDSSLLQADATSWIAFYTVLMLKISLELANKVSKAYEDLASKFFEHFVLVADAINALTEGREGLWSEEDSIYYDALETPYGRLPIEVRSLVGLTPLFACGVIPSATMKDLPGFSKRTDWFIRNRKDLAKQLAFADDSQGTGKLFMLSITSENRIRSLLQHMFDESAFLSEHGIRSLSKFHESNPYVLNVDGVTHRVEYNPGESTSSMFGGNSNWRGPVWMPMNFLLTEALERIDHFYGRNLSIQYPTGSPLTCTPFEASMNLCSRLAGLFLPNEKGVRPCHGSGDNMQVFATDPHWKHLIYFYEHFHGDTGRGIGAKHQTGWTGLVVNCLFRLGRYRSARAEVCEYSFLNSNYETFMPASWDNLEDLELEYEREKRGFPTIKALMEHLFLTQPWIYRNLLLSYASRHNTGDSKRSYD